MKLWKKWKINSIGVFESKKCDFMGCTEFKNPYGVKTAKILLQFLHYRAFYF
jgi:hypothetical protein